MQEALLGGTPYSNRLLFVMILLHCAPSDPCGLFETFWEAMLSPRWSKERLLRFLARKMQLNNAPLDKELFAGIDVRDLNQHDDELEADEGGASHNLPDERTRDGTKTLNNTYHTKVCFLISANFAKLNDEQRRVVTTVEEAVRDYARDLAHVDRLFFMEGPAGTGKTFTYKVLYDRLVAAGLNVLCTAFTGVAAALLPNGRTLHAALGLPVPLTKDSKSRLYPHTEQSAPLLACFKVFL
jgi:hypothetical protein